MSGKARRSAGAIRAISAATSPSAFASANGLRGLLIACSIISTYGRYGGAPLISTQCPVSTRIPRAWASSPISATSRDLPMPGSPATSASLPRRRARRRQAGAGWPARRPAPRMR